MTVTIAEAARMTNRSSEAVRALVRRRGLPVYSRNGYNVRVDLADVLAVVQEVEARAR